MNAVMIHTIVMSMLIVQTPSVASVANVRMDIVEIVLIVRVRIL